MEIKLNNYIEAPYGENLVRARGLDPKTFLEPNENNMLSPILLDNIIFAADWVIKNVNKKAATIVDSDCDGFCASAILLNYLKQLYPEWNIDFFVHERKGHGLSDIVEDVDISEYDLIFLPDAGTNDDIYFEEYKDTHFIILDHHLRTSENPIPSNAIIVNNQLSEGYSNKFLSGAGVTWQFVRYLDMISQTSYANNLIDLAAVAIIGDVMNITTPENQYIITKGLSNLQNTFLKYLRDNSAYKIGDTLTPTGVAFYMVPFINSMCRMGTIDEKKRMFMSFIDPTHQVESHKRGVAAGTMVDVVIETIRECTNAKSRQSRLQDNMAALCDKQIIENDLLTNKILTIVLDENFDNIPSEMNGLTATKISNDTGHPTLIGRVGNDNMYKGSIRGLTTIDMPPFKEFLQSSGFFTMVEGHNNAAGFEIPYKKLDRFIAWSNEQLKDISLDTKTWYVDFLKDANDDNIIDIVKEMDNFKNYWGQGFPEALIAVKDIPVKRSDVSVMGKNMDTVKITYNGISYMFFKQSQSEVKKILEHSNFKLSIVGTANLNKYYSKVTSQIFVCDYSISPDFNF